MTQMDDGIARQMGPLEGLWYDIKLKVAGLRRRYIPYLVWHGQQVDIRVTFLENRLHPVDPDHPEDAVHQLMSGALAKIEQDLREIGIEFDRGLGCGGRDWEWDSSLEGPVSLSFMGVTEKPERRK